MEIEVGDSDERFREKRVREQKPKAKKEEEFDGGMAIEEINKLNRR
jgi:hypothetical protein